jgi:PAS domain S-box-containing protein
MAIKEIKKPVSSMSKDELRQEVRELQHQVKEFKKLQAEKERRIEKEDLLRSRAIFESIVDPVFIYDALSYKFLHCNEAAVDNYGYSREEILSMTPFDLYRPEDFEMVRKTVDKKAAGSAVVHTHLTKDRRERIVEVSTSEVFFQGTAAWMTIAHDITERRLMEEELDRHKYRLEEMVNERTLEVLIANKKLKEEILERKKAEQGILESEKKFRSVIAKFLSGVVLVNEKGSIIEWNLAQEKIYGIQRSMVVGNKIWEVLSRHEPYKGKSNGERKNLKSLWEKFLESGENPFKTNPYISTIVKADGKLRDIQQLYFSIPTDEGIVGVVTTSDITEKLELEKQLMQAGKMEAMGTMAGGIAHDFNNILAAIIGYTDLTMRNTDKDAPTRRYLDQVLTASRRAADLVKQILTFSRPDHREKEPLRVSSIVKEALKLLRSTIPTTIEIVSRLKAEDCYVNADPTQLHQVIMNLCTNAWHAMKETGGLIEVGLSEETVEAGLYKDVEAGPYVRLTVSDTGHGIKQEQLEKIFDPFYSTKKSGEGTGMGLAVVHRIVQNHKGNISVFSKEGEGTLFSILLPMAVNVVVKEEAAEEDIPGGEERILLVEDDEPLAEAVKTLLEELGYTVTAMSNGVEAFEVFQKVPDRFDFIITDYTMPRMTGAQLTRKIRSIRSDIPVILCTGHNQVITPQRAESLGIGEIIMKPIELGHIARSIRKLLGKEAS